MRGRKPSVQRNKPRAAPKRRRAASPRRSAAALTAQPVSSVDDVAATLPDPEAVPRPITQDTFRAMYEPAMQREGFVTEIDLPAMRVMSQAFWIASAAADHLRDDPFTRMDENGIERKSPWIQIWRDAATAFRAYAAEFGMTPVARARVTPRAAGRKSLDELLNGDGD